MSKRSGASDSIRQPELNAARNSPSVTRRGPQPPGWRLLAGAAAGVEQCAGERAGLGEADEGGLRTADVPGWWRVGVGVIPIGVWGVRCCHVLIFSLAREAAVRVERALAVDWSTEVRGARTQTNR